jgi:predicted nucleic acid-binding protein
VRWIADTSAWARRGIPEIGDQLAALLDEAPENELVLTGPVLMELLREPQGPAVAELRAEYEQAMLILPVTPAAQAAALDALQTLAAHGPESHRLPISDLLTAAIAAESECGIVHIDGDFELIAEHSGLRFEHRRLRLPDSRAETPSPAARQRELRRELNGLLHAVPVADAERLLVRFVEETRDAQA